MRRRVRSAVAAFRVSTIESGPAEGLRLGDRYASNNYRSGKIEEPVQQALGELLRPGDVYFDVGANVGFFTLVASRFTGSKGSLYAFEARPEIARTAKKNLRRNSIAATVLPVAVGDADGKVALLVADHPGGSTIEPSKAVSTTRTELVGQVTLDSLVATGGVEVPDLVKIDVEGAELAVLRGMTAILERHQPIVLFEVDDAMSSKVEAQYLEIQEMLSGFGYRCERLDPSYPNVSWSVIHAIARPCSAQD